MGVILSLAFGFIILIKGADWLVDGARSLARKLKISELVIGLTVVAFGTSTPELFVNIFASLQGNTEIAIGNIVGSNIFNILVILGVSSLIFPLKVTEGSVWKEIPFSLLAVIILGVLANDRVLDKTAFSALTQKDGIILIVFFCLFMYYLVRISLGERNNQRTDAERRVLWKSLCLVGGGLVGLAFGGKLVEESAVIMAGNLGVSQSLIGLTIVSAGTSLPELATSAVAAYKKSPDIAVGNIIGSNIFNILFVLGISSLIKPLPIIPHMNVDILVLAGISVLLFLFMFSGRRHIIDRWEGALFVVLYISYLLLLLKRG
jgi:cation:H+ antiporter